MRDEGKDHILMTRDDLREVVREASRPSGSMPLYLTLVGSAWASAALSVLIADSAEGTLWASFVGGIVAIIVGIAWGIAPKRDR
ncbi:hypothetical protein GCM10023340_36580 [Nocardioides marinquilinus]|uniref:DUF2530 domain-containing protein n=1 Tax=Nocardioides marinquilinus TaxID=1210400 RepID=A0ABP9Q1S8_9ACTN